jgi:carboxyl-terminal processing protease
MRRIPLVLAAALVATMAFAKVVDPDSSTLLLKPTADDADAAILASRFLTRFHYKPMPLDDAMSRKIFDGYLDALDGDRLFFTRADIDRFASARDALDDAIYERELGVPFSIFNLYEQRVAERVAYARGLLPKGFDFSLKEDYDFGREDAAWPASEAALDDIWRKRVKNDWLRLKLAKESGSDSGSAEDEGSATGGGDSADEPASGGDAEPAKPRAENAGSGETATAGSNAAGAKKSAKDIAAEIRETLDKRYANYLDRVQELDREDVFQTFMNAYAMAIEPHTNYLGPRASANFDVAMSLSLEGIGAVLQRDDEYTAIREIVPGGPAGLSGKLEVGDRIVGVGQGESGPIVDVIGWRLDDVVDKIRGPKDTIVRLEILPAEVGPDGKHELLALTRKKVSIEEQAAKKSVIEVERDDVTHRIGVISLPTFYQDFEARRRGDEDFRSATRDVERLLGELRQEKVDGVVIDLRNNGGGSLAEATDLTGLFIDHGPVVQVRSAGGRVEEENDPKPGMAWDGPLAVLVNRASASASEIFAAAIQDYGRGVVIGEPTFGKGTVQNLVDLDEVAHNEKPTYGELKMTIAQFFRINGGSTQLRGVTPDISFPLTVAADEFGESSYDNALPWTSIAPADYRVAADLEPIIPMLAQRHEARVADNTEWKDLLADLAAARERRAQKTVSLNETLRRTERAEQESQRRSREAHSEHAVPDADPATRTQRKVLEDITTPVAPDADAPDAAGSVSPPADDGLQPNERGVREELAREKSREERRDVVLEEAAHILADEIELIHGDTQLAAQVLPHGARMPPPDAAPADAVGD